MTSEQSKLIDRFMERIYHASNRPLCRIPSAYAYEQPELLKRLNCGHHRSARECLDQLDEGFRQDLQKLEKTSAAATFSPHRPQEDSPYFVETPTLKELDILFPYPDGTIRETHVVHIGPKGSGKTSVQNQWLQLNHDRLENANVFYVRCDGPKMFEFWQRHFEDPEEWPIASMPTVEEYLDFQTLYILAKRRDGGLPKKIFDRIKKDNVKFEFKEARAIDAPERSSKEISFYLTDHIAKHVNIFEWGDPERSYLRDSLFPDKRTKRREYFRWKECADAVKHWMRDNGILSLRILDGVDNLHLNTEAGKAVYGAFISEVRKFILRAAPRNEVRFAVMRNRTWIDVLYGDPITVASSMIMCPRVVSHMPPKAADVLNLRVSWLKSHLTSGESAKFIESTVPALPQADILHQNMRTVICNAASLAEQVCFRYHQLGRQIDLRHQATVQMKRNLFLNGRFYLATQRDFTQMNREKGLLYLNPFWFSDDFTLSSSVRDPLFLRIRLLELLFTGDLLHHEVLRCLTEGFSYDKKCVEMAIDDARAFGWVDSKSELSGSSHITYELSAAGKYLLTDLLSDVDVLYMLALDTRLPKQFFRDGLIPVHTNHMHERSGYIGAAVVTVFTFVSWLANQMKHELESINISSFAGMYTQQFLSGEWVNGIKLQLTRILSQADQEDWDLISSKFEQFIRSEQNADAVPKSAI